MKIFRLFSIFMVLAMVLNLAANPAFAQPPKAGPDDIATITILHTNDFHGQLETVIGSNPGIARTAYAINQVRTAVGAENVLLMDAGDEMQGSLLSNMFHGESTIDIFNQVGYDVATFGNHEFDWGQTVLMSRTLDADYPFVSANIVVNNTGDCATAGWTSPTFAVPYTTITVGSPVTATIGIIGVTTQETPYITIASATEGLCFKDPALSIEHYYDELNAVSDAIVVLSHLGNTDGGYGYGFTVYGDQTLAHMLFLAGAAPDLIIGGHSHTNLSSAQVVDGITIAQAHYNGRKVGKATMTIDKATGDVAVAWERLTVNPPTNPPPPDPPTPGDPEDPNIAAAVAIWASDPWYQQEINRVVGFTNVSMLRNYDGDSAVGAFVNDSIYGSLNNDIEPTNDVDMVFNNAGGLRADIVIPGGATLPYTMTHGILFNVLPFGNATITGQMTGAQIVELLNQSATLFKGALQVSGVRYKFYRYQDTVTWAWGAYDIQVLDKATNTYVAIDVNKTYNVATNEFLAPAGQDGYLPFKYMTNIKYWGDMLNQVEDWVEETYPVTDPYDMGLDGRITREGDNTTGPIVPVTILHNNDPHGRLVKTVSGSNTYQGLTQLYTIVKQETAHNPDRTILLNAGDVIQGDSMSFYFKTAPYGVTADGTPIITPTMWIQPSVAAMNLMGYDAMTLGNHEFNFGPNVFTSTLGMADFPMLGANVTDDGSYGLAEVPVLPSTQIVLPGPDGDIHVGILGITNHRVPNYELPSNIPGLDFLDPILTAQTMEAGVAAANDAVVALTHIGFTTNPSSLEVDNNVDTFLAANTNLIDAIIGGHSHTDPSKQTQYSGGYKFLPTIVGSEDDQAVIVNQAYRYNTYVGEVILGLKWNGTDYDVVARAGKYISVPTSTVEDPELLALMQPYVNMLNTYNNTVLGQTTVPLDALQAFTQETNAANLQADASVAAVEQTGLQVDFHLSGATTNAAIAASATITDPVSVTVADMFKLVPYENSLVVIEMNGPQLKAVLERAYRNYWYYNYTPDHGGYSYYTTCMLDTNSGTVITYRDTYPTTPHGNNVESLVVNGVPVDFTDADTYYNVSTVNYLAAGSCNFNDNGVSLWPLDQIIADTQLYVREASIAYVQDQGVVSPTIEGRLQWLLFSLQMFLPSLGK